jgi:predicted GNAT family acetyltransferase
VSVRRNCSRLILSMADDEQVFLQVTSDPNEIGAQIDRRLQIDPVRATILGTIRIALGWDDVECWCAATADGTAVAVRANPHYPVVLDGEWPASEVTELAACLARLPHLAGITGALDSVRSVAAFLPAITPTRMMFNRLYRLDALTAPTGVSGAVRRATTADRDLVYEWYQAFGHEAGGMHVDPQRDVDRALSSTGCWLWIDHGNVVSLATRRPVVAGSARIGPVYTPAQWRGRGYGSAVTAAASRDILADGGVPVLFADLANPTSNDIYQRLGYYPVEDRLQIEFR